MASRLYTNIRQLINVRPNSKVLRGPELAILPIIENGYLIIEDGIIAEYGPMADLDPGNAMISGAIDTHHAAVLPCWCDSHTHIVFAGSREAEFVDRIRGLSYAEIAAKGGGILHSAARLNEISEDELFNDAWKRLEELIKLGSGAIEIKSGYGLTVEGELKMLRVIKKLKDRSRAQIKSTFLGAHTFPLEYKENHNGYIDLLVNEMLPVIGKEKLADYIDVFCEKGFFSAAEAETVCVAGARHGLKPKLHVNQMNSIGGIEAGIRSGALSLDHLEVLKEEEIGLLSGSIKAGYAGKTWTGISTLLPTAAFFLGMQMPQARKLIDSGAAVALASDYNPGTSPGGNMNFVVALSCIQMKMLPAEAINAATNNGAYAMELGNVLGTITPGKKANLIFTRPVPSYAYIPYSFATNLIERVMINGEFIS